jgi:hypothetical protein
MNNLHIINPSHIAAPINKSAAISPAILSSSSSATTLVTNKNKRTINNEDDIDFLLNILLQRVDKMFDIPGSLFITNLHVEMVLLPENKILLCVV